MAIAIDFTGSFATTFTDLHVANLAEHCHVLQAVNMDNSNLLSDHAVAALLSGRSHDSGEVSYVSSDGGDDSGSGESSGGGDGAVVSVSVIEGEACLNLSSNSPRQQVRNATLRTVNFEDVAHLTDASVKLLVGEYLFLPSCMI
jgi:hypothetical protein